MINSKGSFPVPDYRSLLHMVYNPVACMYRSTGVAVAKFSRNKQLAKKFVDFLVSESGKKIYREYGWYSASHKTEGGYNTN